MIDIDGVIDKWMDEQVLDGWVDRWFDGWMVDGQMIDDRSINHQLSKI